MNLLVLTSEYPNPRSEHDTPVVHYYTKEWLQQGHDVRVVHSRSVFPAVFYPIARALKRLVKRFFRTDFIPFHRLRGIERATLDGVEVISLPIFKLVPHIRYTRRTIARHAQQIHQLCAADGFVPEALICHFVNPQLPLISELKRLYPGIPASLVLHEDPRVIGDLFGREAKGLVDRVDYLGFRYEAMRARYVAAHGPRPHLFLCPSGVPDRYILPAVPPTKFSEPVLQLCFVGMLIPLKNVDVLLRAVHAAFPKKDVRLRIVGEGFLRPQLEALTAELGLADCVRFDGRMPREAVQQVLVDADAFVMVSKPEAFGLVYLEAMAKGCLTIGTRGQGIDGVIDDGRNGFLCEARDVDALRTVLERIAGMPLGARRTMAEEARRTAAEMSDGKVAAAYLATLGLPGAA